MSTSLLGRIADASKGLLCSFDRHGVNGTRVCNDGYRFTRCTRCKAAMVETEAGWTTSPSGYRIVWKPAPEAASRFVLQVNGPVKEPDGTKPKVDRRINRYAVAHARRQRAGAEHRRTSFGRKA